MKYIRTEDGIYEDAGTDGGGWRCVRYKGNKIALSQDDDKIVKEADTIEKLCDEFDVYCPCWRGQGHNLTDCYKIALEDYKNRKTAYSAMLFGGIWTDKGFIYVTKMNEKGELELL